ncbi:MAG TPA: glycine zipper 2TM domain-containing protein [Acidiferrobacteraceae bacterium]|nr:glycine zipper 2TM domain-containing protein [Acidiferrobacteraceae bacterium]
MKKTIIITTATLLALSVTGCETATKEGVGGITGAIVGSILGAQVGGGHGRDAAIAIGALAGAMVGSNLGRHLDEHDEARARDVLEHNRTGQSSHWENPHSGAHVTMVPTSSYRSSTGQNCREYQTEVIVGGKKEAAYGTACRQSDGAWKIVN